MIKIGATESRAELAGVARHSRAGMATGQIAVEDFRPTYGSDYCAVLVAEVQPQYDELEMQKLAILRDAVRAGFESGVAEDFSIAALNERLDREAERKRAGHGAV